MFNMWKNISILASLAASVRGVRFCRLRIDRDAPTSYAISKADWQAHRNEGPEYLFILRDHVTINTISYCGCCEDEGLAS
jgi:hypothetical protein